MKHLMVLVFLLTLLSGCQSDVATSFKIGVIIPLTGPVAEPGNNVLQGIQIALDQYNSNHERQIQIVVEDSQSSPRVGVTAINKLIFSDKVGVIIGDLMSSVFLATAPIAEENKIVMISPGASNPDVRNAGDYIFRIYASDNYDGKVMANYMYNNIKLENVGVIAVNNDYGIGVKNTFASSFNKLGGFIKYNEVYSEGQADFRTLIQKAKDAEIDGLYIAGNPTENGNLVKQMRELNYDTTITGNLSFENEDFINVARNSFESITFSAPYFNLDSEEPAVESFVRLYEGKYGKRPDVAASLGYDVFEVLVEGLQNCDYDATALNNSLYQLPVLNGVTGRIKFDEMGDVEKDIYIKYVKGDGFVGVLEVYTTF